MKSVSLYVHIPYCVSKCAYCDFYSEPCCAIPDSYIDNLIEEIDARKAKFQVDIWKTVYIGGGTPSLLSQNQLEKLCAKILPNLEDGAEFTIECNPDDVTADLLICLVACKINRISVGMQCFDDDALSFVNRRANRLANLRAIELVKKHFLARNENRFSIDLISGLPKLSDENFIESLKLATTSGADHISLYSLTIEDGTPLAKNLAHYSDEANERQWLLGRDYLERCGFFQYEVSNFSKRGFESRHNLTYWKKDDYIGVGSGATGTIGGYRYTNGMLLNRAKGEYALDSVVEHLSQKDLEFEFLMMGFRTLRGISETEYKNRFRASLATRLGETFIEWQAQNLATTYETEQREKFYALTREGLLVLNRFLAEL